MINFLFIYTYDVHLFKILLLPKRKLLYNPSNRTHSGHSLLLLILHPLTTLPPLPLSPKLTIDNYDAPTNPL